MGISGKSIRDPVYIHFDFDEYRPWLLDKDDDEVYFIWKMVPPGKSYYFYSFGGEEADCEAAKDQPKYAPSRNKVIKDI